MTSMDKAGMAMAIAITAIFLGIAASMGAVQDTPTYTAPVDSTPKVSPETSEPEPQADPFADIADKVKSEDDTMEKETVELEEEISMEETHEDIKEETMVEETHEEPAGPTTHIVDIPTGTSVPGCEESNACYLPADITINAGDTVEWINVDTAAHTVTGGSPADGPSGVFDSSLVMASANYAFTFDDAGSYDYFCMVHPWMVGSVTVN